MELDFDDREIKFASNANNSWSYDLREANGLDAADLNTFDIIMIILASLLFIGFGVCVCIKCRKKPQNMDSAEADVQEHLYNETTTGGGVAAGEADLDKEFA
jgi:hypothetical protein